MKQTKFLIMALMASTLMMSSCALKKDLQNCQSENRELTQNYQDTKEKLAAAEARLASLRSSFLVPRRIMPSCRTRWTRV